MDHMSVSSTRHVRNVDWYLTQNGYPHTPVQMGAQKRNDYSIPRTKGSTKTRELTKWNSCDTIVV
jgi:hypothetical protein